MALVQTIFLLLLLSVQSNSKQQGWWNDDGDTDNTDDATDVSSGRACPAGWFHRLNDCYYYAETETTYFVASSRCKELGAELRVIRNDLQNNVLSDNMENYYWLGIEREDFHSYWRIFGNEIVTYNKLSYDNDNANCITWRSSDSVWFASNCNTNYRYMCQKPAVCPNGFYGEQCKEECRCKQETCDLMSGICQGGCPIGWHGSGCNFEKKRAIAKFYCFKERSANTMIFRVNQRNTTYRYITALDTEGNVVVSCSKKIVFSSFKKGGLATLKIVQSTDNFKYTPSCGEDKEAAGIFSWRFKFQEYYATSSLYDILFLVKCDFKTADNMERSTEAINDEQNENLTMVLHESKVSVRLDVVDPFSGDKILSSKLGQHIALKLSLSNVEEYGISAITPYNCSVGTLDGKHDVMIADDYGCKPKYARVYFLKTNGVTWRSEVFETFTFPGYSSLNFRCHFHVCFSDDQQLCLNTCKNKKIISGTHDRARNIVPAMKKPSTVGTILNVI